MKNKVLPEAMERMSIPSITLGDTEFSRTSRTSASFTDTPKGMDWLRDIGEDALIKETVHHATLSSFITNYLKDNAMDPPPFVKVATMPYVKMKTV
jgi:hypothetical protein